VRATRVLGRLRLPSEEPRRTLLLLALVTLAAAVFRFPGLGYPAQEYFDEVYHAKTALQYLHGEPPTEWVHPPTAKLLIAVGVWWFGYEPWAWRLLPAIAGTLIAPVFFLLARRALATERAAILATTLLLLDGVYLVQSRVAMTNVFAVLFQLLSVLLVLRATSAWRSASRCRRGGRASGPGASSVSSSSSGGKGALSAPASWLSPCSPSPSFPPPSTC
jgi:dolichyl-phosphate-mannose--protein O-mannosyl transferase